MIQIIKSNERTAGHCSECRISLEEALADSNQDIYIIELGTNQSFYSHRLCREHFAEFSSAIMQRLTALQPTANSTAGEFGG